MTNYNERLDEILSKLARNATLAYKTAEIATTPSAANDASKRYEWSIVDAKQALDSLIKGLVAEAKPEGFDEVEPSTDYSRGAVDAIDQFEQNLLKALEEV